MASPKARGQENPSGPASAEKSEHRPIFISTWAFGRPVNDQALATISSGSSLLDAIERGIWVAEADAANASVGLGGIPNADGVVQLDACIMWGPGHRAGSVAAVEDILHPISVARLVMEQTPHVMLVGAGARQFALQHGMEPTQLLTPEREQAWQQWRRQQASERQGQNPNPTAHDTITLLGLDGQGNLAGGCSTSGWGYKLPGRVGDSPILGSGLYVDNEVGAAGATGRGENVMRYGASLLIVEAMRRGAPPVDACLEVIQRIIRHDPIPQEQLSINFIALDKQGRFGAAGTDASFQFAVTTPHHSEVHAATIVK